MLGLALAVGLLLSSASAISYTVQVVALSDQAAALALQQRLSRLGFPVYLVSVPTQNGVVSRIRVGAFANRAAAVRFAGAFDAVEGSVPAPALAEGIPRGLIPLEPELLDTYPYIPGTTRLEVLPWNDGAAIRFQGSFEGEPMEASYRVLNVGLADAAFDAWRAAPTSDGDIIRVYNFTLWLDQGKAAPAELESYETSLLRTIAGSLDVGVDILRTYRFHTPGAGMPYLVLVERFDPGSGANIRFRALGKPVPGEVSVAGPRLVWLGPATEALPTGLPEPLFRPQDVLGTNPSAIELSSRDAWQVSGDGWTARPDGRYTRLALEKGDAGWRALPGFPLWAQGDYLLVYNESEIMLYTLQRP